MAFPRIRIRRPKTLGQDEYYEFYYPKVEDVSEKYQFPTPVVSSGEASSALPILQSAISSIGQIIPKYLELKTAKQKAEEAEALAARTAQQAQILKTLGTAPTTAGIPSGVLLLGLGVGALILLSKRGDKRRKR